MSKILFLILLIFIKENISFEATNNFRITKNVSIEPNISRTIFLNYLNITNISFNIKENSSLQINIRTINCKIEISGEEIIKNDYFEFYYLLLNSKNNKILVKPSKNKVDGLYKENYELKKCPIVINSYYISDSTQQQVHIMNKEENFFFISIIHYIVMFFIFLII